MSTTLAMPASERADIAALPLALGETTELRNGPDGRPFVFNSTSGRVVAVHGPGGRIIELMDGTRTLSQLLELFGVATVSDDDPRRLALTNFVVGLHDAGMLRDLTGHADAGTYTEVEHIPRDMPPGWKFRVHLPGRADALTVPRDRTIGFRLGIALLAALGVGLVGHVLVALALAGEVSSVSALPERTPGALALILPIVLVQVAIHEGAHAMALRLFGLSTREVGFRFWFYVLPLPYVSQSAEVFLPQRSQRLAVALAGICVDGLTGMLVLLVLMPHVTTPILISWTLFHLMVLTVNLNPLLPTDGARAVEAALGEVSLRQRCVRWARASLMRYPAPPGSPTTLGKKLYGVVSVLFGLFIALAITAQIIAGILRGV